MPSEISQRKTNTVWYDLYWASLLAQTVKNLPKMQETKVPFLGQEDPLEKEMATHSSILAWKIQRTEEPDRLQSERAGHDLAHTNKGQKFVFGKQKSIRARSKSRCYKKKSQ